MLTLEILLFAIQHDFFRISTKGTLEFLHDHADTSPSKVKRGVKGQSNSRNRVLHSAVHPLSHIVLTVEATNTFDSKQRRTFTVVVLASGVVPQLYGDDDPLFTSSVSADLRHGISVCQKTLSAMQHVLLSVAAAKEFHTFRHSRLTYLLQNALSSSDVLLIVIGVKTSLIDHERSAHLLNIGKRIFKSASKARVTSLLEGDVLRKRVAPTRAAAWR